LGRVPFLLPEVLLSFPYAGFFEACFYCGGFLFFHGGLINEKAESFIYTFKQHPASD